MDSIAIGPMAKGLIDRTKPSHSFVARNRRFFLGESRPAEGFHPRFQR